MNDSNAARAGGIMDAMDHLGATVGALLTGTVVLPALGTGPTLRGLAVMCSAVTGVWVLRAVSRNGVGP